MLVRIDWAMWLECAGIPVHIKLMGSREIFMVKAMIIFMAKEEIMNESTLLELRSSEYSGISNRGKSHCSLPGE